MISSFKERPLGGFYCNECKMVFGEISEVCPFCGSIVSNYEELLTRANPDTTPTKNIIEGENDNESNIY